MKKFIVTIVAYVVIGLGLVWECITKYNVLGEMETIAVKDLDYDLNKKDEVIALKLSEVLACVYVMFCWPYLLIAPIIDHFKEK